MDCKRATAALHQAIDGGGVVVTGTALQCQITFGNHSAVAAQATGSHMERECSRGLELAVVHQRGGGHRTRAARSGRHTQHTRGAVGECGGGRHHAVGACAALQRATVVDAGDIDGQPVAEHLATSGIGERRSRTVHRQLLPRLHHARGLVVQAAGDAGGEIAFGDECAGVGNLVGSECFTARTLQRSAVGQCVGNTDGVGGCALL